MKRNTLVRFVLMAMFVGVLGAAAVPTPAHAIGCGIDPNGGG